MTPRRLTLLLSIAALLLTSAVSAAVPPVTDALWGVSQPWIPVPVPAGTRGVRLTMTGLVSTCADPIAARATAPSTECSTAIRTGTALDVLVHVFDGATGMEVREPMRCRPSSPATCTLDLAVAGGTSGYALLIHGGPGAQGRLSGSLTVALDGNPTVHAIALSDNILLDVSVPPPGGYDIASVLVTDGPSRSGFTVRAGNDVNDHLGVDATEMWLLDSSFRVVGADLAQSGVGSAAFLPHVEGVRAARWALVRPFNPPAGVTVRLPGGAAVPMADGSKSPTVGPGRMRVIVNDRYTNDADGDGLSTAVEDQYLLCNGLNDYTPGRSCVRASFLRDHPDMAWMDPRDTDGDGISDGAEVLGSDVASGTTPTATGPNIGSCAAANPRQVTDADQTFPLWGFDPRHKDMLVEIDRSAAGEATCATTMTGCPADGRVVDAPYDLVSWHERYARLPARLVNNPDGLDGIEIHFDARLSPVATQRHGTVPQFSLSDYTGTVRPGLVLFVPPPATASQCACNGATMCVSPRHGGYARYAIYSNPGGGGNANCGGWINYGSNGGGLAASHEMGHHLGLQHGGPTNCLGNPFGFDTTVEPEIVLSSKIPYISAMSYLYVYDPLIGFSEGRHSPLPRPADFTTRPFGYPEPETFWGADTRAVDRNLGYPAGARYRLERCVPAETTCTHLDFNRDGDWTDFVQGPLNGAYWYGRDFFTTIPNYYCSVEREPSWAGPCCTTPLVPGSSPAACSGMGTRTQWVVTQTMIQAGTPAATVANNRLYEFFVDDFVTDDDVRPAIPPRRCGLSAQAATGCTPFVPGAPMRGKIRWGRLEGFSAARDSRSRTPCLGIAAECATGKQVGNLAIGGPPTDSALYGNTLLSATTIPDGTGERVILAWASRGDSTRSGFDCDPATTCPSWWSPLHVRFARGTEVETTGFSVSGAGDVQFPAGEDARVSGVAIAAWNPATGRKDVAFLVARQALTNRLFWTLCRPSGCDRMQPLRAGGTQLVSNGPIAMAAENGDTPRLAVVRTNGNVVDLLRFIPGSSVPSPTVLALQRIPIAQPIGVAQEAALSIAFTAPPDNRMLLNFENGAPTTFHLTGRNDTLGATGSTIDLAYDDTNPWDLSRGSNRIDPATNQPIMHSGPGAVWALIFDPRTGITDDPRIRVLERRVRAFGSVVGQGALYNQSFTVADGQSDTPGHDYDDVAALAWAVCPTVAASGLGMAGPDLPAGAQPLRCPTAQATDRGGLPNDLRRFSRCRFTPARLCILPDDPLRRELDIRDWVVRWLVKPERTLARIPSILDVERFVPILRHEIPLCTVGAESAAAALPKVRSVFDLMFPPLGGQFKQGFKQ